MFLILPVLGGYLGYIALAGLVALVAGCSSNSRHEDVPPPAPPPVPTPRDQMAPAIPRAPDAEFSRSLQQHSGPLRCYDIRPRRALDREMLRSIRSLNSTDFEIPPDIEVNTIFSGRREDPHITDQIIDAILWPHPQTPYEILAFGEGHRLFSNYEGKLPVEVFLQLLPALTRRGYHHLVFEYLPSDYVGVNSLPRPYDEFLHSVPPESESLMRGVFTYIFNSPVLVDGCLGYLRNIPPFLQAVGNPFHPTNPQAVLETAITIRNHAQTRLEEANGRRPTLFYGGLMHVPSFPSIENQGAMLQLSFGPQLMAQGHNYHAVEIINPSFLSSLIYGAAQASGSSNPMPPIRQLLWYLNTHGFIPPHDRVNVVRVSLNGRVMDYIVFPYEN